MLMVESSELLRKCRLIKLPYMFDVFSKYYECSDNDATPHRPQSPRPGSSAGGESPNYNIYHLNILNIICQMYSDELKADRYEDII